MNLEFFVRDLRLTRKGLAPLVGDTAGYYTFSIDFDSQWDDLVKVVVFRNGTDTAQMIYTGQSPLPAAVSGRGDLYVACHGYRNKGDSVAVLRTIAMSRPVRLLGASPMPGGSQKPFTPAVFDQVMGAAADAKSAAKQANAAASAAQEMTRELQLLLQQAAEQGLSITAVSVAEMPGGHRVTIHSTGGSQSFPVADGVSVSSVALREVTEEGRVYALVLSDGREETFLAPAGPTGAAGAGVSVVSVTQSDADGGSNTVTFSDGTVLTVKNGSKGETGTVDTAVLDQYMPRSGGTFAGTVAAAQSGQSEGAYVLRNTMLAAAETDPTVNGEICWTYE